MKKKPRKQTRRERALVRAVNETLRVFDDDHPCNDCWAEDEKHTDDCITTTLRRALKVKP
jgi:ubiquitin